MILTPKGQIKLVDFGIAAFMADIQDTGDNSNLIIGTPRYLSPERMNGKPATAQSDVFSLGVVLYELIPVLLNTLHDSDMRIRLSAFWTLASLNPANVFDLLFDFVLDVCCTTDEGAVAFGDLDRWRRGRTCATLPHGATDIGWKRHLNIGKGRCMFQLTC